MLTEEQIEEYREAAEQIVRPLEDYLLRDLAARVAAAGELTSTAAYQVWKLQELGLSQKQIKQKLAELLDTGQEEIERLLTQSAVDGYRFDLSRLPTGEGIPFEKNESLQAVVAEAVKLAGEGLANITQTLGMTDPTGRALPLQDVYRKTCDFAFTQVVTGTTDYQTAIRRATRELAEKGVCVVDYASGRHISVEAAVRRNVFGAMGLIQEKINADYHDRLGCDGWEISAHAASAPDHEPIQGKQYTDEEYARLNDSLVRRIGTLNCAHSAMPIRLGIDRPIHSPEELRELREKNEEGFTYGGRHYTSYEAKQHRRELERKIRQQRKRVLVDEATRDAEKLQNDRIRLVTMESGYKRFCDATGARQEYARLEVTKYGPKQATQAKKTYEDVAKQANLMYDTGSERSNIAAWRRDQPIRKKIGSEEYPLVLHQGRQNKHIPGTHEYQQYRENMISRGLCGPARLTADTEFVQQLVERYHGAGILRRTKDGAWNHQEVITVNPEIIGVSVNRNTGAEQDTCVFTIHYSRSGYHIVPAYPSWRGAKDKNAILDR